MQPITCYKLTDENLCTRGTFKWDLGVPRTANGVGDLCGPGWLHGYLASPLLAVLLNPLHGAYNLDKARIFEGKAEGTIRHDLGLKFGCTRMTLLREVPMPQVTTAQRVHFAKLCAEWAAEAALQPRLSPIAVATKLAALAEQACGVADA